MAYIPAKRPSLGTPTIKQKNFANVRGVDFNTEYCSDSRSPDMCGFYRDWNRSGDCIQMMPGFRVIASLPHLFGAILGVHFFDTKIGADNVTKVLIHAGSYLYDWINFNECTAYDPSEEPPAPFMNVIYHGLNRADKSKSFVFDNKLYILNYMHYLVYTVKDGVMRVANSDDVVIPFTYTSRNYLGGGVQSEQRNLLTPKFKNSFLGDGNSAHKTYQLSETEIDDEIEVKVNGAVLSGATDYTFSRLAGTVTFTVAPSAPAIQGQDNVEITASKQIEGNERITTNREVLIFDNRVFLTGNPHYPNDIRYSQVNSPAYFGEINYVADGKGASPIVNLIKVGSDNFAAIKKTTEQDGMIYFHSPLEMNYDFLPKVYPSKAGVSGVGAVSHFGTNTLRDDPMFLTENGIEAVGKLSYGLERAIEHRSSFVDVKMRMEADKDKAVTAIWRGYFCVLFPSGNMYMADSRMRAEVRNSQSIEYDWFFIKDVGLYDGQTAVEIDANSRKPISELQEMAADEALSEEERQNAQTLLDNALVVTEMQGGTFSPPTILFEHDDELYFGCENGKLCKFNTDMLVESSRELQSNAFNNDGRKIDAYYTTPFSDYGAFNVLKKFEKRGNVLWTESYKSGSIIPKVRTNKSLFREYPTANSGYFSYDNWDYADFTYNTFNQVSIVFRKIKEKKWQLAQLRLENGRINTAFGIYEINLRARIMNYVKK